MVGRICSAGFKSGTAMFDNRGTCAGRSGGSGGRGHSWKDFANKTYKILNFVESTI